MLSTYAPKMWEFLLLHCLNKRFIDDKSTVHNYNINILIKLTHLTHLYFNTRFVHIKIFKKNYNYTNTNTNYILYKLHVECKYL